MKTINKIKTKKTPLVLLFITIALLVTYAILANIFAWWPFVQDVSRDNIPEKDSPTSQGSTGDNTIKLDGSKQPIQNEDAGKTALSPSITINHRSIQDNTLRIRVTIDTIKASGVCTLTLSQTSSGKMITKSAAIVPNPSSSTCEGFDIPLSELGSGTWSIKVDVSGSDISSEALSEVTI